MTVAIMMIMIYFYDDIDNSNNDGDDRDDDGGNVGEWVVLTVPLSRQLQFLMQAGRCQVMMLLFKLVMMIAVMMRNSNPRIIETILTKSNNYS